MGCGVSRRHVVPERGGSPKENGSARGSSAKENGSTRGGSGKNGSVRGGSGKENGFSPIRSPVRSDVAQQQQAKEQRLKMIQERQLRTVSAAQELSGRYLEDRDRLSVSITNGTSHLSSRTSSPHGSRANSKRVHFEKGSLPGERDPPPPSSSRGPAPSLHQEPKTVAVR